MLPVCTAAAYDEGLQRVCDRTASSRNAWDAGFTQAVVAHPIGLTINRPPDHAIHEDRKFKRPFPPPAALLQSTLRVLFEPRAAAGLYTGFRDNSIKVDVATEADLAPSSCTWYTSTGLNVVWRLIR